MCGSTKAPKVVEQDPVAEQRAAEAAATTAANQELAARRSRRRASSLLGLGANGLDRPGTAQRLLAGAAPAGNKTTLGGQ